MTGIEGEGKAERLRFGTRNMSKPTVGNKAAVMEWGMNHLGHLGISG